MIEETGLKRPPLWVVLFLAFVFAALWFCILAVILGGLSWLGWVSSAIIFVVLAVFFRLGT